MDDILKAHYKSLGEKGSSKRWAGHIKKTKEELREYNKLKMREYRAKRK